MPVVMLVAIRHELYGAKWLSFVLLLLPVEFETEEEGVQLITNRLESS